jgi:hypothetical protein
MLMTFWQARIFRAKDYYHPDHETTQIEASTVDDCAVQVSLGRIPTEVEHAQAGVNSALYRLMSLEGPSPTAVPVEWRDPNELFSTILISMGIDMEVLSGEFYPLLQERWWYASHPAELGRNKYLFHAQPIFEKVSGNLLRALGSDIVNAAVPDSKTFMEWPGRETMPVILSKVGGARAIISRTMPELGATPLAKAFEPVAMRDSSGLLTTAGKWVGTALQEKDPVKQFLWCFAGLDAISSKSIKLLRNRGLTRKIHFKIDDDVADVTGTAVNELLWPSAHRDAMPEQPDRNITFKFAALALMKSPETANHDVELFKEMQRFRNLIHGGGLLDVQASEKLTPKALKLLTKYTKLAVSLI